MIRVLHSVSNMDRAGIETMIMNYYRHMDRSLVQFDFLCNKAKPGDYDAEIRAMGGQIYLSPGFNPAKFPRYVKVVKRILRESPQIQIVHAHNGAFGVYALAAGKLAGVKHRVYHAHGTHLPRDFKQAYKWLCKKFINCFCTDRLACGDAAARFFYGPRVCEKGGYTLIRNAIDLSVFRYCAENRARLRAEKGLEGCFVVGHAGRFSLEKNHARLLDVFAVIAKARPEARLLLVGEGELMAAAREKARALGLEGRVIMPGSVPDIYNWYPLMDAFVMPSLWEGLPVVGIEAQAFGLPCVFSTGIPEAVRVTEGAVSVPLSEGDEAWAQAILRAAAEHPPRDTAKELRAAGYDIRAEAAKLQELYLNLANR